ncbi:hypothetical protein [Escherichia coli]|uniref:hypothetical protein n=1 Tax=Escherichia coli TaxID=562 RepID=UPI0012CFC45D|nr:hypothetical protein [Salmonella enterica subsp. enterica serovar Carmel]
MNVVSMMRVMLCASDMQTIPIFTGPFQNLKYRGSVDAQKRAIYENFQGKSRSVLLLANLLFNRVFLKKRKDLAAVIFR